MKHKRYSRQTRQAFMLRTAVYVGAGALLTVTGALCAFVLVRGLVHLSPSLFAWHYTSDNASLLPALINTITLTAITLLISIPFGVGSAVYLTEYAKRGGHLVALIRVTAETLAGIPSIIYGLAGYMMFVAALHWQFSILAGAATAAIMVLPVIMRTAEEALLAVSDDLRAASLALGAGKLRTICCVSLPAARHGIASGITLAAGRVVGETAALIYTAGTVARVPSTVMGSGRTLAVHLYALWCEGLNAKSADATAAVLVLFVMLCSAISAALGRAQGAKHNEERKNHGQ